jgi:hydroxymethylpyrimidine pyrophosphatase-like HAD family hydrolase
VLTTVVDSYFMMNPDNMEPSRNRIRLFVCDWEGCVTDPRGGSFPWQLDAMAELARVIRQLHDTQGAPGFVLCTGRQFPYGEAALQAINAIWDNLPSIMENGAGLYYPKTREVVPNPAITPERLETLDRVRQKAQQIARARGGRVLAGKEFSVSAIPPAGVAIEEYCVEFQRELADFVNAGVIENPTHSKSAVDITPQGVNKGTGTRFLSEITHIPLTAMVGIGDTAGDLAMLKEVGHPCAPANADNMVRNLVAEKGGYVSPLPTTQGVIDIVRRYAGIQLQVAVK